MLCKTQSNFLYGLNVEMLFTKPLHAKYFLQSYNRYCNSKTKQNKNNTKKQTNKQKTDVVCTVCVHRNCR